MLSSPGLVSFRARWFFLGVVTLLGAMVLADARVMHATLSPVGLFDSSVFHKVSHFNARRRSWVLTEDSEVVLGGLWARSPQSVGLSVSPTVQSRRVRILANGTMLRELEVGAPQVVLLQAQSDAEGFLRLRLTGVQSVPEATPFEIRVGRIEVRQEGPPAIPARRWMQYGLLVSIVGALVWLAWAEGATRSVMGGLALVLFPVALTVSRIRTLTCLPWILFVLSTALALVAVCHLALGMQRSHSRWLALASVLKLAFALQPGFPVGDSLFHAHKAWEVRQGQVATSRAPGPDRQAMAVPYPPAFHVLLRLFFNGSDTDADEIVVVQIAVVLLEASAPALLFGLMRAGGASTLAAGSAAVAYAAMPEGILVPAKGIAANAFGGWVGLAVVWAITRHSPVGVLIALFTLAALSHVGAGITLATLVVSWMCYGAIRRQISWERAATVLGAGAVAGGLAWLVYYRETAGVLRGGLASSQSAILTTPTRFFSVGWVQLGKTVQDLVLKFGGFPLVVAAFGLRQAAIPSSLRPLLVCWLGTGLFFGAAAVLTPFPLRFEYFLVPAVAMTAGLAAEALPERGRRLAAMAWGLTGLLQAAIGWSLALGRFQLMSVMMDSHKWPFPVQ